LSAHDCDTAQPVIKVLEDGSEELWWRDRETKELIEPIGVDRQMDVPGIHTPSVAAEKHSVPLEVQIARMWPKSG
jgi:hypothetical protein